jgi:AAA domain-containing protein
MIAARLQASSPPEPFADDAAGLDYFATDFHYEHLVARLCRHLAATRGFMLVSGMPVPDGDLVERALNARQDGPHRAALVRCRAGMTLDAVTRAYGRQLGLKDEADGADQWSLLSRLMEDSRRGVVRVLVLENADALDDRSFDALHRFTTLDDPHFLPVVLLTARSFAARLDARSLQFLQPAIVAHLALQHLEPEEVPAFIRYQLNASDGRHEAAFTREAVAAIAAAAKGDPAVVNRLARQAAGILPAPVAAPPAPPAPPHPAATVTTLKQPKPEPRPVAKVVEAARPVAVEPAAERAALPSAAKPSFTAATLAKVAAARRESATPASSRAAAWRARARGMAPAATIAGYVLLAVASAAALLYLLVPSADRDATLAAQAPQIQTMIAGDMPTLAPSLVIPATTETPPASDSTAAAPPPAVPEKPPAQAAPTQPSVAAQSPAEPPATVAPPTLGERVANALAEIEPTGSAKPPSRNQAIAKVEAEAAPLPPRPADKPPTALAAPLVRRGEALLASGDIASARHFFERAAEAGDPAAACGLGKSYDPLFLQRVATRGVVGDPAKAADWYRRAARGGSNEAAARLARLLVKFPQ